MRYGLQFVPQGAFPQDITVGVQLADEQPVVIADEPIPCPEAAPGCTPAVLRLQLSSFFVTNFVGEGGCPSLSFGLTAVVPDIGVFGGESEDNTYTVSLPDLFTGYWADALSYSFLQINVVGNVCGHRTRFRFLDTSNAPQTFYSGGTYTTTVALAAWAFANLIPSNTDGGHWTTGAPISEDGALLFMYPNDPPSWSGSITVQIQIDLTDAAVGSETWTDIGPILILEA